MRLLKDGARTRHPETGLVKRHRGRYLRRHWRVGRRSEGAAEVADVAAHEDECCGRGAG